VLGAFGCRVLGSFAARVLSAFGCKVLARGCPEFRVWGIA